MNGELAQLVALTAYGNAALAVPGNTVELVGRHSTFKFVNQATFGREACHETVAWWQAFRLRGITRLQLARIGPPANRMPLDEHLASAFSRGVRAGILAPLAAATELWMAGWKVSHPKDPGQKIWSVTYEPAGAPGGHHWANPALPEARAALASSLMRIHQFAEATRLTEWTPWFGDATALLTSSNPTPPFHPDLLPETGYPLPARQLLAAAARGWVFGGMGSWNDVGSTDPSYEPLTREYFQSVMNAIVAATNAFDPN